MYIFNQIFLVGRNVENSERIIDRTIKINIKRKNSELITQRRIIKIKLLKRRIGNYLIRMCE